MRRIKSIYFLILIAILFASCQSNEGISTRQAPKKRRISPPIIQPLQDPSLERLAIENPTDTTEERYNKDNKIYRVGRSFYFNFQYKDKSGKILWAKVKSYTNFDDFDIVSKASPSKNCITGFRAVVQPGRKPFSNLNNDFNKSVLAYEYLLPNGVFDQVALIPMVENPKNIWIVPPRNFLLKVLELSPYPYVKFPLDTIKKWYYRKTVSDKWGDERWMQWKGPTEARYTYYNKGRRLANHPYLGEISVYYIRGIGSIKGKTSSVDFYFNEEYGFVQMNYLNVDSSRISIVLFKAEK